MVYINAILKTIILNEIKIAVSEMNKIYVQYQIDIELLCLCKILQIYVVVNNDLQLKEKLKKKIQCDFNYQQCY